MKRHLNRFTTINPTNKNLKLIRQRLNKQSLRNPSHIPPHPLTIANLFNRFSVFIVCCSLACFSVFPVLAVEFDLSIDAKYGSYEWPNKSLPITGHASVVFQAKGANDLHIAIANSEDDGATLYEVVIGGWGNTQSVIRRSRAGANEAITNNTDAMLDNGWATYWVTLSNGRIAYGKGSEPGHNEKLSWQDPTPHNGLKWIGFSTWNAPIQYRDIEIASFITASHGAYTWVDETLPGFGQGAIIFQAQGTNDVHVTIADQQTDGANAYEIVIGGWGNTQSVIRRSQGGPNEAITNDTDAMLDSGWGTYWVTVENGRVAYGKGAEAGINEKLSWQDPTPQPDLQWVGFSTWNVPVSYQSISIFLAIEARYGAYQWTHRALPKIGQGTVIFEAQGSNDVHVAIAENENSTTNLYEIVIGGWGNTQSVIRRSRGGAIEAVTNNSDAMLDSGWGTYWVTAKNGRVSYGKGNEPGVNEKLSWQDPSPHATPQWIGFSTWNTPINFRNTKTVLAIEPSYTSYQWGNWRLSQAGQGSVVFQAKGSNDIHVAFADNEHDTANLYEIVIGGWNNSKSVIRRYRAGAYEASTYDNSAMIEDGWASYWAMISNGRISFGKGNVPGQNEQLSWQDPAPHTGIKWIGFSTWDAQVLYADIQPSDYYFNPEPHISGQWSAVYDWPIIPIHTLLLPDERLMTFGTNTVGTQGGHLVYDLAEYDASSPTPFIHDTSLNPSGSDLFCSAQILSSKTGKALIFGGDDGYDESNNGNDKTVLFDPSNDSMSQGPTMPLRRWYPTAITLPDGKVLIQGGVDTFVGGGTPTAIKTPEIYDPVGNSLSSLLNANSDYAYGKYANANTLGNRWWYPRSWAISSGQVFGISANAMYMLDTDGYGAIEEKGYFSANNVGASSTAVMFQPDKILQFGGGDTQNDGFSNTPGSTHATVFDLSSGSPEITETGSLTLGRHWATSTLLANGTVLATGGSEYNVQLNRGQGAARHAELWNPDTGQWQTMSPETHARLYHSTAILLPDGRVLSGGGGAPGPVNNLNVQIFSPPYLFDQAGLATRPSLLLTNISYTYGDPISFDVGSSDTISRVTLIKSGAVTHSFNSEQRFYELAFNKTNNTITGTLPSSSSILTPGYYLLFVINDQGTPSVGRLITLD
ncbi:MAG: hypothetical protein COB04_17470 [Gammaproteobacteria bacterium]|nr:MAG: hypothetical protein COB04_17470 [Gammaproteobacteria bacterium]